MSPQTISEVKKLSDNIATELVFAEAGKDLGLLPINSLLGQIDEMLATQSPPSGLAEGVRLARSWIDRCFDGSGTLSADDIKKFGEWTGWMQESLAACEGESQSPAIPPGWSEIPPLQPVAACSAANPTVSNPIHGVGAGFSLDLESDGDLLREFVNESHEHLQNIEQGALVLEGNSSDADTLNSIFRAFHTFKGGAGFLNLTPIQTLAHELESLLDLARRHELTLTSGVIELILAGGDTLKRFTSEISRRLSDSSAEPIVIATDDLLARLKAVKLGEKVDSVKQRHPETETVVEAKTTSLPPTHSNSVKVETSKLDSLIDLVGEMVVAQSLVVQNPIVGALRDEKLTRDLARLARISKDLQRTAMSLRMVPIRGTFQKMSRLVRDLSAKLGKQVELVTEGEDTELDRTLVEEISDPLIHMIRNSVDHGIEGPEARAGKGKPVKGTVRLKAFHRAGNIVIQIADDGGGLNPARILAKAIEQGLAKSGEPLTEAQIFNFILAAGFSTAEKVTDVSGRGVGMDVVRRNIEKLRGKIDIQSVVGKGSTFSIYLPLTLAIIDGLLVGVGEHRYIFPTLSVCESFQPTPGMITQVQGHGEVVKVRGRLQPVLRLYDHLGIKPGSTDPTRSVIVVLESGSSMRCILVDQLLGKQEIVIKSLGELFRQNRCMAGAAILGDGRIGIILDPQALVHLETNSLKEAA